MESLGECSAAGVLSNVTLEIHHWEIYPTVANLTHTFIHTTNIINNTKIKIGNTV